MENLSAGIRARQVPLRPARHRRNRPHRHDDSLPADVISDDNPDGIFERGVTFDFDVLKKRLREMAFLNKGIHITFTDERGETPVTEDFLYEGGLREFVKYLNHNKEVLFPEPILPRA